MLVKGNFQGNKMYKFKICGRKKLIKKSSSIQMKLEGSKNIQSRIGYKQKWHEEVNSYISVISLLKKQRMLIWNWKFSYIMLIRNMFKIQGHRLKAQESELHWRVMNQKEEPDYISFIKKIDSKGKIITRDEEKLWPNDK